METLDRIRELISKEDTHTQFRKQWGRLPDGRYECILILDVKSTSGRSEQTILKMVSNQIEDDSEIIDWIYDRLYSETGEKPYPWHPAYWIKRNHKLVLAFIIGLIFGSR